MSTAIAISNGQDLIAFDDRKLELIRKTIAKDLTVDQFELFMSVARARGLDPIQNQIHAIVRNMKVSKNPDRFEKRMTIQVGIDGFRLVAARTGEYAGSDKTVFQFNSQDQIISAETTVYRMVGGVRCAFTGEAYWSEFYPGETNGFMWNDKPRTMLAKCSEAQALRKAFPNDLSGLYEPAEISEREVSAPIQESQGALAPVDDDKLLIQIKDVCAKFRKLGVAETEICYKLSVPTIEDISELQLAELNNIGRAIAHDKKPITDFFKRGAK